MEQRIKARGCAQHAADGQTGARWHTQHEPMGLGYLPYLIPRNAITPGHFSAKMVVSRSVSVVGEL